MSTERDLHLEMLDHIEMLHDRITRLEGIMDYAKSAAKMVKKAAGSTYRAAGKAMKAVARKLANTDPIIKIRDEINALQKHNGGFKVTGVKVGIDEEGNSEYQAVGMSDKHETDTDIKIIQDHDTKSFMVQVGDEKGTHKNWDAVVRHVKSYFGVTTKK